LRGFLPDVLQIISTVSEFSCRAGSVLISFDFFFLIYFLFLQFF
jgi:hypothetical protein